MTLEATGFSVLVSVPASNAGWNTTRRRWNRRGYIDAMTQMGVRLKGWV